MPYRKERRKKERYDVNRNRQEELGTGRVADRKWRNQVQEGTEMERTGNGTDRKEVDRKWTRASGQEESEQEIEQSQERDKKWKEKGIE